MLSTAAYLVHQTVQLFREPCSCIAFTCGVCLSGYVSTPTGESNNRCFLRGKATAIRRRKDWTEPVHPIGIVQVFISAIILELVNSPIKSVREIVRSVSVVNMWLQQPDQSCRRVAWINTIVLRSASVRRDIRD